MATETLKEITEQRNRLSHEIEGWKKANQRWVDKLAECKKERDKLREELEATRFDRIQSIEVKKTEDYHIKTKWITVAELEIVFNETRKRLI